MKPENILVFLNEEEAEVVSAKLIDLEYVVEKGSPESRERKGDPRYMPEAVKRDEGRRPAVRADDLFALGGVIAELTITTEKTFSEAQRQRLALLIERLTVENPTQRPTAKEAITELQAIRKL